MKWDGTSLDVKGAITATSGTFTGDINAAGGTFTGHVTAGNAKFGLNVASTNDGLYLGAHNYWYDDGSFKVGDASDNMVWDGTDLSITGDLNAASGTITGATLVGGSIAVPSASSPTFQVTAGGVMSATGASITGDITATTGTIGGWTVGASTLYSPASTTSNRLTLNAGGAPSLTINNSCLLYTSPSPRDS